MAQVMNLHNSINDFLEFERRQILVEITEKGAAEDLDTLIELGEFARVKKICDEALEKMK